MFRVGAIILCVLVLVVGFAPTSSVVADTSISFIIDGFPYSGPPPEGVESYTLVGDGLTLSGDTYTDSVTQSAFQSGLTGTLITYNMDMDVDVMPKSVTVDHFGDSNNGTCNANMEKYVTAIFFDDADAVMYPDPFRAGVTAVGIVTNNAGSWQGISINFETYLAYGESFPLSTLRPSKILIGIGTLCTGTTDSRTITVSAREVSFYYDIIEDDPVYLRPLLSSDGWTNNQFGSPYFHASGTYNPDLVVSTSKSPGAPVMSIAGGLVTEVTRLPGTNPVDCLIDITGGIDWLIPSEFPCQFAHNATQASPLATTIALGNGYWWGDDRDIWRVTVDTDSGIIRYVVAGANLLVAESATITAGCVLGRTLPATFLQAELLGATRPVFGLGKPPTTEGYALIDRNSGDDELLDFLIEPPVEGTPCNASEETKNCLGNADLSASGSWEESGSVTYKTGGGALIGRNSFIIATRPFNLNENRLPQMRVSLRNSVGTSNSVSLKIGLTTQTFTITSSGFQVYEITASAHEANVDDYYDIAVFNNGQGTIDIEYICVSHSLLPDEETPIPPPPPHPDGCLFKAPSMEGDGWSISSGVQNLSGSYGVPHNGTFSQPIALSPNGESSQTYTVKVRASLWYYNTFTLSPTDDTDITISYDWGDGYTTIATYTIGQFVQAEFGVIEFSNILTVATQKTETWTFRHTSSAQPSGLRGIQVRDVCIEAGDTRDGSPGDEFPGYDEPPGIPPDRPLPEECSTGELASGDGIGAWISWLWGRLNGFFQCELMVMLNDIYQTIIRFFRMVGWSIRWGMMTFQMTINWVANQVLPYFAGYMVNIMGSQPQDNVIYTNNPGGGGGTYEECQWYDIFCHARNLFDTVGAVVGGVGDFLGGLLQGIIDVIGGLLGAIVSVVEWLWARLSELINSVINIIRGLIEVILQVVGWIIQAIGTVLGFILGIVTAIVTALVNFVRGVIGWIITALAVVGAIITGASTATPQTIPGLPSCTSDDAHPLCLIYWALENTIFAGLGGVIIPLVTAFMAIRFAIWYLGRVRTMVMKAVQTS